MKIRSDSFSDGTAIPGVYAFCVADPQNHVALSQNRNPHLAWDDVPPGTRSFALVVHDPDVPSRSDDVNQEDREVPSNLPRVDFFHWILWNIPADVREIAEGAHSDGVTPRGKSGPDAPGGLQHGINDYTGWFAGDAEMAGTYYGYDGPCPPWNDSIVHQYVFTIHALDVERLEIEGDPTGAVVREALEAHTLASASLTGLYSLNPRIPAR
jgi:hypothetical protein